MPSVLRVKYFGKKREGSKLRKDRSRRKWSDPGHFCPISAHDRPVLWDFSFCEISPFCGHSALWSLGRDTIPVRARSAALQRWENERVLSSLFFCGSKAGDVRCLFKAEDIGGRDVEDAAEIGKRVERGKFVSAQIVRDRRRRDAEKFGKVGLRVTALTDTFAQTQMDIV